MHQHRSFDDAFASAIAGLGAADLSPRDRALARLIASTVLRRHGELAAVVATFIEKPLPADRGHLTPILLCAAAQMLALDTAPHAAINIAVEQCRADHKARRFDKLANAVLRRVAEQGPDILRKLDGPRLNIPDWLWQAWTRAYGETAARRIAIASLRQAPLDLTVKSDATGWAERLGGQVLPTGGVRCEPGGRVDEMDGFGDGAWWVQDTAAALPARLLGDVAGLLVADLCASPGGKTAQLAAAGANVTAVDNSGPRLVRLAENLSRLKLQAKIVEADVLTWAPGETFDAVLLDAPCTSTGTIRRHPDILHLKRADDVSPLAGLQARMLDRAAGLVAPGGLLVFCTCSLAPEEGEHQVAAFLARNPEFGREVIRPEEICLDPDCVNAAGELRSLPFHLQGDIRPHAGLDGFFAARLRRKNP